MRKLLSVAAMAGLALAQPARASDVPLHEALDQVLGAELVALMLEAQLDRLRGAMTNPDIQVIVVKDKPVLIDARRVDDLVFAGQQLADADPKVREALKSALKEELGVVAEGIDLMPDSAVAPLAAQALIQKLAELEEAQAEMLKREALQRESTLSQLKFMIDVWWKEIYPDYIDLDVEFRGYEECRWQVELVRTGRFAEFDFTTWRMYDSVWTWVPSTHNCGWPDAPDDQTPYQPAQPQFAFPMAAHYDTGMYDLRRIDGNLDIGADCKYYGNPKHPQLIEGDWGCESGFKTHGRRIHYGKVRITLYR